MRISRVCFANVADFRTTFVRVSHECRENVHVSQTRRELVAKVLNMFKFFMRIFSPKYFARLSCDVRASVANLSSRNIGEFTMRNFCDTHTKIKLSDIRTSVVRHSHECRATVVRIKMKISYIRGKVVRHSHECRATVVRQSRDYRTTVARYICKIKPKFATLSHKCLFDETAT